ncbi:MAG: 30S ribosomal protein S16 [Puniceicoccales bacterium]|jgi:small subunit ribosomal protein S16|nr:30S ribosomal protein S16 [Puniceicoccales bacterium]
MALKIRLQRRGNRNRPVYKIVVAESTSRRDGKFVEAIGNYNPNARGNTPALALILDRADYWMSVGAKPTDTVKSLIKKAREFQISA